MLSLTTGDWIFGHYSCVSSGAHACQLSEDEDHNDTIGQPFIATVMRTLGRLGRVGPRLTLCVLVSEGQPSVRLLILHLLPLCAILYDQVQDDLAGFGVCEQPQTRFCWRASHRTRWISRILVRWKSDGGVEAVEFGELPIYKDEKDVRRSRGESRQ